MDEPSDPDNYWTMEICSRRRWFEIDLAEIWRYRDLILLLVRRDFVAVYKQTVLGPIWFLLAPLFSTVVFTIVFGNIARIPTDGVPPFLFYLAGTVTWSYFSSCMTTTSNTFIANAGIFGKVYFPRLVVPISVVITNLLSFLIQFGLFIAVLLYYLLTGSSVHPTIYILLLPFILIQMAALGLGMGVLISSLTTKYRDLAMLLTFGVQLWMYATPIVYPLSQIPEKWQWASALNPMTAVVETFRFAFLGCGGIQVWIILVSLVMTGLILGSGILLFSRIEKTFMDTV
jgi:lipopolysaccharide transport system permease protein